MAIAAAVWPEDEVNWETLSSYVRSYIHTFKKAFALISPYPLIVSSANGYGINPELNIMTDLQQFDLLGEKAMQAPTIPHKVDLLKKAAALYNGSVFENASGELWINTTATHYRFRYTGIINELLSTLDGAGDFTEVQQYAMKAIELTPENVNAHYWLLRAMNHFGTLELARNHIAHAREILTSEEFSSLRERIAQDSAMPYTMLFRDE